MPIYSYRCETCGHQQDILQKMSDPLLVTCPSCGNATFRKQVTAAGFQLKGSGWYVTDFRNQGKDTSKSAKPADDAKGGDDKASAAPASDAAPAPAADAGQAAKTEPATAKVAPPAPSSAS